MLLELTIHQLDIGFVPNDQAEELGQLGFVQWMGGLPGDANYASEAARAYDLGRPFIQVSPAVAVFCRLLIQSLATPCAPISFSMGQRSRRGGASARRALL